MKLQRKTLIILALTVFGMILAIYLILSGIMTESYKKLEIQTSIQNSKRVYNALYNKIDNINILVADWAQWDDTYEFVVDRNKDYIKSNLTEATFIQDELNVILYYNKQNQIIWEKGYDLENEEYTEVPDSLKKYIADHSSLLLNQEDIESNVMGIVLLPEGPMMLCSNPILNSDSEGPVRGRLFFGRFLDSTALEELSDTTHFDVSMYRIDEGTSDTILKKAVDSFSEFSDTVIEPINSDTLSAYTQIKDVSDKLILVMKINMPRSIYMQGQKTINYFLLSLILIGTSFCILIYVLLENYVISKLLSLGKSVSNIANDQDFSSRIKFTGNDELSNLGENINQMLESLEEKQNIIKTSKDELEIRVNERTSELQTVNIALQNEVNIREQKEIELKTNLESLSKRNKYEKIIRSVAESVNKTKGLQQIIDNAIKSIHDNIEHATTVSLYLVDGTDALLKGSIGHLKSFTKKVSKIPYPKGFTWRTIIDNKPLLCNDIDFDSTMGKTGNILGIKSYLSVPLRSGDKAIGCLKIDSFNKHSFSIEDQNLLEIVASQIDVAINNSKQAEALRQSEERYKALFDQSPVGVYIFDKNYKITNCNERMVDIIGSSREQIVGLDMTKLKDKVFMPSMEKALNGEICYQEDIYNATTTSNKMWQALTLTPLLDNENNVIEGMAVVEDITERKNAEQNLLKSLEEKDMLLKEIHHRVKNNLQIISSLLHLQSDNIKHTEEFNAEIFKESQDRIRSIALIHEKLYSSENFGEVNIKDYLTTLASSLVRSYRINTKVKIDAENIYLNIDKSVTCGLIINELLTNSLKHAFHDNSDGQIHIQFLRQNSHYELIVKDNGMGLSEDFDIDNTNTFGLKLVKRLTQQLEGTINYEVNNGTMFKIDFH